MISKYKKLPRYGRWLILSLLLSLFSVLDASESVPGYVVGASGGLLFALFVGELFWYYEKRRTL